MIITKKQQEKLVDQYIRDKNNTDKCVGFIDGINATLELVDRIMKEDDSINRH